MKIQIKMSGQNGLQFEVISTRTVEPTNQKKYVAYKVSIRKLSGAEDINPAFLERRYNEFLALYNGLKREFPSHFLWLQFPRKAIIGNFNPDMISLRSAGFEAFLSLIGSESQLRHSPMVISFLQNKELVEVITLIQRQEYDKARPLVENGFRLMNKMQTDRAPSVLRWLCLFVCVCWFSGDKRAEALAGLAIRRYQAVSDIDLLKYYVPLLHLAKKICHGSTAETEIIVNQLAKLKACGMLTDNNSDLLSLLVEDLSQLVVS